MATEQQLGYAIAIAAQAHEGQVDKGGEAYVLHPLAVMFKVAPDRTRMIIAVLHDTLEDAPSYMGIINIAKDFGPVVSSALNLLTRKDDQHYFEYIEDIASHPDARAVKIADLTHNMDTGRLPLGDLGEKDYRRWDKYRRALVRLTRED